MKQLWSNFYGGIIDVVIVEDIKQIPNKARYKYTEDEGLSIYSDGESFWGLCL